MTTAASIGPKAARALLQTACARNRPAELHCECDNQSLVARLRLLRLDRDQICTDAPQFAFGTEVLARHQHVVIYLIVEGSRYTFRTRVANPRLLVELNAENRILGMGLQIPGRIETQQRRADYRVSVAGQDVPIRFRRVEGADGAPATDKEDGPFEGRVTNISAGGAGTIVDYAQHKSFALGQRYIVEFKLPGADEAFELDAEIRNFRDVPVNESHVVGLRFLPAVDPSTRSHFAQINRFVVAQQRRELQVRSNYK